MQYKQYTGCPFSFSTASFGDKWTILILREILVMHKCYYDEFLQIAEGISTNILADRLKEMEKKQLITRRKDPENLRRWIYEPTEKSLDLIPVLFEFAIWAAKYDPKTEVKPRHIEAFTKNRKKTIKEWRKPFEPKH